jgi:hypothetical protein
LKKIPQSPLFLTRVLFYLLGDGQFLCQIKKLQEIARTNIHFKAGKPAQIISLHSSGPPRKIIGRQERIKNEKIFSRKEVTKNKSLDAIHIYVDIIPESSNVM